MHTKNYQAFAKMFAGEMASARADEFKESFRTRNIIRLAADLFAQDNERFDRATFYEACGIGKDGFQ
jgi:hypothetical protein